LIHFYKSFFSDKLKLHLKSNAEMDIEYDRDETNETLSLNDMDVSEEASEEDVIDGTNNETEQNFALLFERILSVHVIKSKITGYLSPVDFKNSVLVCRKWKELLEVSCLWKWAIVRMQTIDLSNIDILLQSPRFRLIENVQLRIDNPREEEGPLSSHDIEEIHNHLEKLADFILENHEEMELRRFDLDLRIRQINRIQPPTLFQAVSNLVEVNLSHRGDKNIFQMSPAFFSHLANATDIHLQTLRFSGISLYNVPAEDLGSVVSRLEVIDFSNTDLSYPQIRNIFDRLSTTNNRLRELNLSYNNLMMISCSQVARVVSGLRSWDWVSCHLSNNQMAAIVTEMAECPQLRLRSASFNENLSHVEKEVLAKAVVRLENVKFFDNKFSSDQLDCLLKAIVKTERLSLKSLEFSHCNLDLSSQDLLARAVCRLESVDLVVSQVTKAHSNAIFRQIIQAEALKLRNLTLEGPCNLWDNELETESSKKLRSYVGPRFKKYNW